MNDYSSQIIPRGSLLDNRYIVLGQLARGRISTIYKCHDQNLSGRVVALKVLSAAHCNNIALVDNFRRQVFYSYLISHNNVIRTFEYVNTDNLTAVTMEYVRGKSVDSLAYPISIAKIVEIFIELSKGLEAIHHTGILHGDLRPEHLLLTEAGVPKICGIATAPPRAQLENLVSSNIPNELAYSSPEYLETGEMDKRSDIYSLGVILYEMLTGNIPRSLRHKDESHFVEIQDNYEHFQFLRTDYSKKLSSVILRALQKDPNKRYQKLSNFREGLESVLENISLPISSIEIERSVETLGKPVTEAYPSSPTTKPNNILEAIEESYVNDKSIESLTTRKTVLLTKRSLNRLKRPARRGFGKDNVSQSARRFASKIF